MPRRPATATQADIARAIRAMKDAGYPEVRVVIRADGVTVEIAGQGQMPENDAGHDTLAAQDRVGIL